MQDSQNLQHLLSEIVLTEEASAILVYDQQGLCLGRKGEIDSDVQKFAETFVLKCNLENEKQLSSPTNNSDNPANEKEFTNNRSSDSNSLSKSCLYKNHQFSLRKEEDLTLVLAYAKS